MFEELVVRIAFWWVGANVALVALAVIWAAVLEWRAGRALHREIDRDLQALFGAPGIDIPLPSRRRLARRSGR